MLDIDLTSLVLELINFLALSAALYYFLFRPVIRRVEERAQEKREIQLKIKEEHQKAEAIRMELETRLANINQEVEAVLDEARAAIEMERERMLADIRETADRRLAEVQRESHKIQKQAMQDFHEDLVETIEQISVRMIAKVATEEMHNAMVDELNQKVMNLGRTDMRQVNNLRRSITDRMPTAYVISARELSVDQQRQIVRTTSALADRNVNVELTIEPSLGAGMSVRIGDLVVENSISAQLADLRQEIMRDINERMRNE